MTSMFALLSTLHSERNTLYIHLFQSLQQPVLHCYYHQQRAIACSNAPPLVFLSYCGFDRLHRLFSSLPQNCWKTFIYLRWDNALSQNFSSSITTLIWPKKLAPFCNSQQCWNYFPFFHMNIITVRMSIPFASATLWSSTIGECSSHTVQR